MDPFQKFAQYAGTFFGHAIGHALKIAGPEIRALIAGAILDALSSKDEIAKPNEALQSGLSNANDPAGLLR